MKLITLAVAVLLIAASAVHSQKVKVDFDKSVNFSSYRTFGFSEGQVAINPIVSETIKSTVESELTALGLTRNDAAPDLKLSILAASDMDLQGVGPSWNNENYRFFGGQGNPAALMNITTGTLKIDLVDTKIGRNVWQGIARDTLVRSSSGSAVEDAKNVEKTVKKAIKKMFKQYPARSAK
jgi:hypothetical protein